MILISNNDDKQDNNTLVDNMILVGEPVNWTLQ
jgi:hypothetical protein